MIVPGFVGFVAGFIAATLWWFALEYAHGFKGVFYHIV